MDSMAQESKKFVVFLCKSCRLPLGDSSDWDGHVTEKEGFVHLTAVSEHILCSREPVVSSFPGDEGCYAPGSAKKQVLPQCDAPVTLNKCVEYDEEVKKLKQLLGSLQRRIDNLERKASS